MEPQGFFSYFLCFDLKSGSHQFSSTSLRNLNSGRFPAAAKMPLCLGIFSILSVIIISTINCDKGQKLGHGVSTVASKAGNPGFCWVVVDLENMFWPKSLLILALKSSTSKIISPILFMSELNCDTVQISNYQVPLKNVCSQEEMNPGPLNHELSFSLETTATTTRKNTKSYFYWA